MNGNFLHSDISCDDKNLQLPGLNVSEYPQKLKILKATFSWFRVFLFD